MIIHPPNGLDFSAIDPRKHEKYNWNLYRYLSRHLMRRVCDRIYRDECGALWIGHFGANNIFLGTYLSQVLELGDATQTPTWPKANTLHFRTVLGFWNQYERLGSCAIDPSHQDASLDTDGRYSFLPDGSRQCQWCGATQYLFTWTDTITRKRWDSSPDALFALP